MSRLLVAFVFTAAACGSSPGPRAPADPPPAVPRTPTPVPAGYADAGDLTVREGRAALALFFDGKLAELHAMFTPELAAIATVELMTTIRGQLTGAAAPGPDGETVFLMGEVRAYVAELQVGDRGAVAQVGFAGTGRIASLNFAPRAELPADPHAGRALKTQLRLPFDGQWWVFWGGDTATRNYHVVAPDQRHAYDLVMWKDGGTHRGDGKKNEDYHCWGQPILAPADATVVAVASDKPDHPPGTMDPSAPAGNHVVLDFGNGEFALLAHLQAGSVTVKVGAKVTRGQTLGLTGNSGNTSEPHLHFHVQDGPKLFGAAGVPVVFHGVCTDGKPAAPASPVHGQFIEDCE
ncbi:MAG TPA: M23 family metallopeptidase [Kofleriaceae bacterium]|nr:M23 family metallopeptidase [Kofleriaceae bacterium]